METCSTCATILSPDGGDFTSEKPPPDQRRVPCCGRIICGDCIVNNDRFATYCPYCQISSEPGPLPQGLKAPPAYRPGPASRSNAAAAAQPPPPPPTSSPPPYKTLRDPAAAAAVEDEKSGADDTLHFLDHERDSIPSLSLRYGVPQDALRRANRIHGDHLLVARRAVLIPGAFYRAGVSLSPRPVEGEAEERRRAKTCRLMTACKLADHDVARLYLDQAAWDLDRAVDTYVADEAWERAQRRDAGKPRAGIMQRFFGLKR